MQKNFAIFLFNRESLSRIYEEFKKLNTNITNNPVNKRIAELNRYFSEEEQTANRYMKNVILHILNRI
jgi:hypothetical protein